MIKFEVKGMAKLEQRIQNELNKKVNADVKLRLGKLYEAIVENTPIDTGYARSRWTYYEEDVIRISFSFKNPLFIKLTDTRWVFSNDASYIQYLNEGWSKQAPPRYIEQTILQQGMTPVRLI
jgi:hypothetical protein